MVYEAEDLRLGRRVALKFLPDELTNDPQTLARFEREARAASSLNHPNVCTIYEIDKFNGAMFIAMELLEGQSLRDLIASKPMKGETVVAIGIQVVAGLEAAHSKGIVHRDVKPANIFVTKGGQVKILDFGLAKVSFELDGIPSNVSTLELEQDLTVRGALLGTISYMSPEQVTRNRTRRPVRPIFVSGGALRNDDGKARFSG